MPLAAFVGIVGVHDNCHAMALQAPPEQHAHADGCLDCTLAHLQWKIPAQTVGVHMPGEGKLRVQLHFESIIQSAFKDWAILLAGLCNLGLVGRPLLPPQGVSDR